MNLNKKLEKYIAVSGLPGLFELIATRNNGLVLSNLDTGKTKFISIRQHQFTPLATVAIYTNLDTIELSKVFTRMMEQEEDNPIPKHNAPSSDLFEYIEDIIPDYDKDRVFISDIKKVIKWYNFLKEKNVFVETVGASDEEE